MSVIAVMSPSGFFATCAHVTPLSDVPGKSGGDYIFEVLAEEASALEDHLNKPEVYQIEEETVTATLAKLEPCSPEGEAADQAGNHAKWRGVLSVENNLEDTSFLDTLLSTDYLH